VAGPAGAVRAWQTVWKQHKRFSADGTWDAIHAELVAEADAVGEVDWAVSVDSTIKRAHLAAMIWRARRDSNPWPSDP